MGGRSKRVEIYVIHIADSLGCTAETNTTWYSNYTPAKKSVMNTHTHTHRSGSLRRTKTANSVVQDQMPAGLKPRKSPGFNSKGRKKQLFKFALIQPFCIIWAFYSEDEVLPH